MNSGFLKIRFTNSVSVTLRNFGTVYTSFDSAGIRMCPNESAGVRSELKVRIPIGLVLMDRIRWVAFKGQCLRKKSTIQALKSSQSLLRDARLSLIFENRVLGLLIDKITKITMPKIPIRKVSSEQICFHRYPGLRFVGICSS
jgi:hypothetical protein